MRSLCLVIRSPNIASSRVRAALAVAALALCSLAAAAQEQRITPPQPVFPVQMAPQAPAAPPAEAIPPVQTAPPVQAAPRQPGFFESVGRWFDQGAANFRRMNEKAAENSRILNQNAEEARRNAANATKEAIDSMSRLPSTRVVVGRERCEPAANGAPDCHAAAEAMCRKKGFHGGKSLEFTSAEECPARVLLSGRQSAECTTVTFINRAMCQ